MNYKDVSVLECVSALPQTVMQSIENASTLCLETSNAANWCKWEPSTTMEPNSPKKIQFAVPLFQSQIDPEAAEQIRKRRPTPASLVIMNEHMPPEKDEKRTNISQAESQSASPKQRKQSVFTPPALKGIKHLKSQSDSVFPEEEEGVGEREEEWGH
uniref:Protein phosphatase 1 regulatory inhibitor subunit 1C n=1 Tax=Cyanistes caeruleus TaxID=156563 RepID=A0A8C0VSR5_CYACU